MSFTITTSTIGSDDEDEWVSSESRAATLLDDASADSGLGTKTLQEPSQTTPVNLVEQRAKSQNPAHVPGTTPRAELAPLPPPCPRIQTNGFTPTHLLHGAARLSLPFEPSQYPQQEWVPYRQQPRQPMWVFWDGATTCARTSSYG